jgi:hypothetical protein
MISVSKCGAACLVGVTLAGCVQSVHIAGVITKPTIDAFARLGSWQPWRETPMPLSAPIVAEVPPSHVRPAAADELARVSVIERQLQGPRRATAKSRPAIRSGPIPMPAVSEASPIPAKVTCRTSNVPGGRVHMQCFPTEAGR